MDKVTIGLIAGSVLLLLGVIGSYGNLDYVKEHGPDRWREIGFEPIGYEGYEWGVGGYGSSYGGAKVWWRLRNTEDNGITYTGYLKRWGSELHVYGPEATDAISGTR